jgi:fatty-acyl-CoA synthase
MLGLTQDRQLLISGALLHAARNHHDTPIFSRRKDGSFHQSTWKLFEKRVRRLASAMQKRGVGVGDRVATLAWNNYRHLEIFFATAAIGAIFHPINPRLFVEQAVYIALHAEDKALFFDADYANVAKEILSSSSTIAFSIHMDDNPAVPDIGPTADWYEALLEEGSDDFFYPDFDERNAASLCYTSGTTGNPKGVLAAHRAMILHAMAVRTGDVFALTAQSVACVIVPLYHAHGGWGLPLAAAMSGAAVVMPGLALDPANLVDTFRRTQTTVANGVPTIWHGVAAHLDQTREETPLRRVVIAGSAPAEGLIQRLENSHGIQVCHIWGMTETGPCATAGGMPARSRTYAAEQLSALKTKQGHSLYPLELRIVNDEGKPQLWGEHNIGQLQARGPFVLSGYFRGEGRGSVDADGWFSTGDIACLDDNGSLRLVDRAKDLVKSGGEWISSIDVENATLDHPDVKEAAVIAVPHPTWTERPLLLLVLHPGRTLDEESVKGFLATKIAKWWLPDRIIFVPELPRTGTGKVMKAELRKLYANAEGTQFPGA